MSPAADEVYEGTVRLVVETDGYAKEVISFVSELRQNPQLRLLRLVASQYRDGMDIWLGLREPLPLRSILSQIEGVAQVTTLDEPTDEGEHLLAVSLRN